MSGGAGRRTPAGPLSDEDVAGPAARRTPRGPHLLTAGGLVGRVARSGSWTVVASVGSFAGTLAANAVLARILTPAELGAYFLAITLIGSATVVACLGLPRATVRLVAQEVALARPGRAAGTLTSAVRMVALSGFLAALLVSTWPGRWIVVTVWDSPLLGGALVFTGVMLAAEAARIMLSESLRGLHDYRAVALSGEGARAIAVAVLVAAVALVVGDTNLRTALMVTSLASLAMAMVAGALLLPAARRLGPPEPVAGRGLLAVSMPLMITELTTLLLNSGDLWVLGATRSTRNVAVYAAAARVVMIVRVPIFLMAQAVAPTISELHALGDRQRLERLVRGAAFVAAVPTLLLIPAGALFGGSVLRLVFGDFYSQGWTVLVILSFGEAANGLSGPTAMTLSMTGHHRTLMTCGLAAATATLAAEILMAHWIGVNGVAVASAGGVILLHGMLSVVIRRRLGIWTFASFRSLRPIQT